MADLILAPTVDVLERLIAIDITKTRTTVLMNEYYKSKGNQQRPDDARTVLYGSYRSAITLAPLVE